MGKAARWLKGLLGMKKEKEKENLDNSTFGSNDKRDKRRWSFAKSAKDSASLDHSPIPVKVQSSVSASDTDWLTSYVTENEKEQNKHAIAVAAATAAAADAAVAAAQAAVAAVRLTSQGRGALFCRSREKLAAVKIQTVFRGFLARKALRALKALVKLQSLVRGYLVRKRTAATFYSMQALIRAQTAVKNQRASRSLTKEHRFHPRKSHESFDEPRSEFHSQRLSAFHEVAFIESPKIVEIDTYKTRPWSSRRISSSNTLSEYEEDYTYNQPPLPCSDFKQFHQDFEWYFNGDECKFSTAQSTPRFGSFVRSNGPPTPAKSVCGDSFFRPYCIAPNYMADTKSFKAKLRSLSAPKQRPEPGPKKVALQEFMAARNSISGVRMQRSTHAHVRESLNY